MKADQALPLHDGAQAWLFDRGRACQRRMWFVGAPTFPPTDPVSVEILRIPLRLPRLRLGETEADASTDPGGPW